MSEWTFVAYENDIALNSCKTIWVDDQLIAVYHLPDGYFAIEDLCTHENAPLSDGEVEDGEVECCLHGARFSIRTGEALTAPAYEAVATFPVRVRDGQVQVRDARFD